MGGGSTAGGRGGVAPQRRDVASGLVRRAWFAGCPMGQVARGLCAALGAAT